MDDDAWIRANRATNQLFKAAADGGTAAEVTRLLAEGADPTEDWDNDTEEPRPVRACARAALLPADPVALPAPLLAARHSPNASRRCRAP